MGRLLRVAALVAVAGFLITACGSSPQGRTPPGGGPTPATTPTPIPSAAPTSTPAPPAPTTVPTAAPATAGTAPRCLVSELSLAAGQGNAAAGTVGRPFVFTNTSQTTCALFGFPGMQRLGGDGQPMQTRLVWTPSSEQLVTLAPGGTASFLAWWHDQTGYAAPCATSQRVEVTPPNAYSFLTVTVPIQACPDGTINVNAVTGGSTGGQPG